MDQRRTVIITALVGLVILALLAGTIIYLINFLRRGGGIFTSRTVSPSPIVSPSPSPVPGGIVPVPVPVGGSPVPNKQTFTGQGFELRYPREWGLLTCGNSRNFELDPANNVDQLGVSCDRSVKPVTIIVGGGGCQGETVNLGGVTAVRSKATTQTGVNYRWCTQTQPILDITHRVSPVGGRATSRDDFSKEIEEMISTIRFGAAS